MPTPPFAFQKLFETGPDETEYRRLTQEYVSTAEFAGKEMLVVEPEALSLLANQAFHDINFFLRSIGDTPIPDNRACHELGIHRHIAREINE